MGTFDLKVCQTALLAIRGRAERLSSEQIVQSFASVGPVAELLATTDHQVMFGRRGTGKTHALRYLFERIGDEGDIAIFVDMLSLGSDNSIYNNQDLSVSERSTRLLIDTLSHIQEGFLDYATSGININLEKLGKLLDALNEATSEVRIRGASEQTVEKKVTDSTASRSKFGLHGSLNSLTGEAASEREKNKATETISTNKESGIAEYSISFSKVGVAMRDLVQFFNPRRVWILFDEWSSLPLELQPFLADLLRRAFFNLTSVTVKIAAVEHRTKFQLEQQGGGYIGIEPTADIRINIRLDDYLLFDNNREAAIGFFRDFLFKHVSGICAEKSLPLPRDAGQVISVGFSQKNAFEEFVKAAEGVPRDAIYIISNCAQKAFSSTIDVPIVRQAAHRYYQEDKSSQVEENPVLRELLKFVVDSAIRKKKTNSFLLEFGVRDRSIDLLFDRRLVHIRSRNVSSRDNPGARYYHYKIDYGCYVDLVATHQKPDEYDFSLHESIEDIVGRTVVPTEDDARSYRRSILDLDEFYANHPEWRSEGIV